MLNSIVIMGRLTRDPELRYTQSNIAVASFTLAVDRDFGNRDGGEKQTDFIDCVAWRQTGEFAAKYLQKGTLAAVSGRLQLRDWQDKNGNKRRNAEVLVEHVYFGESKKQAATPQPSAPSFGEFPGYGAGNPFQPQTVQAGMFDESDDSLPF